VNWMRLGSDDSAAVNGDPSMTEDPSIPMDEPDHQRRIGASARQSAIEQQAALQAVAIGRAGQLAHSQHT
jgi:hypothetical protein